MLTCTRGVCFDSAYSSGTT